MRKMEFRQGFPHTWLTSLIAHQWIKESNTTAISFSFGTFWSQLLHFLWSLIQLVCSERSNVRSDSSGKVRGGQKQFVNLCGLLGRRPMPACSALSKQRRFGYAQKSWFRIKEELSLTLDLSCCTHNPPMLSGSFTIYKQRTIVPSISGGVVREQVIVCKIFKEQYGSQSGD